LSERFEGHDPGDPGVERVVAPFADVQARMELCAALADEDAPGGHDLSAETLDSQTLGVAVTTVSGTADTFFMSHL
jgi:hypothetical protein